MTTWLLLHWMVLTAISKFPISAEVEYIAEAEYIKKKEASRAEHGFYYVRRLSLRPLFCQAGNDTLFAFSNSLVGPRRRRASVLAHCQPERPQQKSLGRSWTRPGRHFRLDKIKAGE